MSDLDKNQINQTVFKEEGGAPMEGFNSGKGKTASGLEENLAGLLCYLFGFVSGIIFLLIEKENRFIRFHALQSIFTFVAIIVVSIIVNVIPILGLLVSIVITPLSLILWVILMVKAYQGKWFKLPLVGDLVEKQLK